MTTSREVREKFREACLQGYESVRERQRAIEPFKARHAGGLARLRARGRHRANRVRACLARALSGVDGACWRGGTGRERETG